MESGIPDPCHPEQHRRRMKFHQRVQPPHERAYFDGTHLIKESATRISFRKNNRNAVYHIDAVARLLGDKRPKAYTIRLAANRTRRG